MKPETWLMATIFGMSADGPKDDDYHDNVDGMSLTEVIFELLGDISEARKRNAPMLSQRVIPLIRARFGFDGKPKTYQELGEMFDITRERARQNELQIMRSLRHPTRSRKLKPFLK